MTIAGTPAHADLRRARRAAPLRFTIAASRGAHAGRTVEPSRCDDGRSAARRSAAHFVACVGARRRRRRQRRARAGAWCACWKQASASMRARRARPSRSRERTSAATGRIRRAVVDARRHDRRRHQDLALLPRDGGRAHRRALRARAERLRRRARGRRRRLPDPEQRVDLRRRRARRTRSSSGPSAVFTNVRNPRAAVDRKDESSTTASAAARPSAPTRPSCAATRSASTRSSARARWSRATCARTPW